MDEIIKKCNIEQFEQNFQFLNFYWKVMQWDTTFAPDRNSATKIDETIPTQNDEKSIFSKIGEGSQKNHFLPKNMKIETKMEKIDHWRCGEVRTALKAEPTCARPGHRN